MPSLRFLGGSQSGLSLELSGHRYTVGRHPESDVVFDAAEYPTVSVRHAELYRKGEHWYLRDLESRNGTYRNGRRVTSDARLSHHDVLRFGAQGPEVQVVDAARAEARLARGGGLMATLLVVTSMIAVVAVANWVVAPTRWASERERLSGRIDSLIAEGVATERDLNTRLEELGTALGETEALLETSRQGESRAAEGRRTELEVLRRRILVATADLERLQLAASIDAEAVSHATRAAVALVYARFPDGTVSTGSAFAVRADAVLATTAHVVRDPETAALARELRIQFADSDQVWEGRVLTISTEVDLALIRAEGIQGVVPIISLNQRADTVLPGAPVVMVGFPLGGDPEVMEGARRAVARPLVLTGVTSRVTPARLEVVGYGERGASGSPVLDGGGEALGVVLGAPETARSTVLAVPVAEVVELLAGR